MSEIELYNRKEEILPPIKEIDRRKDYSLDGLQAKINDGIIHFSEAPKKKKPTVADLAARLAPIWHKLEPHFKILETLQSPEVAKDKL